MHPEQVSLGFEFRFHVPRNAIFQIELAALKTELRKARRLHGRLDILVEVSNMRDILRVRLRLVPSAHDPKRDARIPLFHEGGNYGVQGPLSGSERIRRGGLEREERTAVVQYEA